MIEQAVCEMLDQVANRYWLMIEARHSRYDLHSDPCELEHILQMDRVDRRLARDQDKFSSFLKMNISSPMHQVCA